MLFSVAVLNVRCKPMMEIDEHAVTFLDVHIYVCDTCDYVLCVTV